MARVCIDHQALQCECAPYLPIRAIDEIREPSRTRAPEHVRDAFGRRRASPGRPGYSGDRSRLFRSSAERPRRGPPSAVDGQSRQAHNVPSPAARTFANTRITAHRTGDLYVCEASHTCRSGRPWSRHRPTTLSVQMAISGHVQMAISGHIAMAADRCPQSEMSRNFRRVWRLTLM